LLFKTLMSFTYEKSDIVVAVSNGVAIDLSKRIKLKRDKIITIYNPIVDSEIINKVNKSFSLVHPWFKKDSPPVILGVGRLSKQKDFQTLINAFAKVRTQKECHLV